MIQEGGGIRPTLTLIKTRYFSVFGHISLFSTLSNLHVFSLLKVVYQTNNKTSYSHIHFQTCCICSECLVNDIKTQIRQQYICLPGLNILVYCFVDIVND